jgi:hypothetical protein
MLPFTDSRSFPTRADGQTGDDIQIVTSSAWAGWWTHDSETD